MSSYENHQLDYSKQGQELESKKRTFLFVVFLSCIAFAGWFFCSEIKSKPQMQKNLISEQKKQTEESKNNRFFRGTTQTRNHIDKTPDEISIPEEISSENSIKKMDDTDKRVEKPSENHIKKMDDTDKSEKKTLVQKEKSSNTDTKKIDEEKLALIGQERPKALYKGPLSIDSCVAFPVTLSWVEYIIRVALPIIGTVFSEESSEIEENCVVRDYYYLKYNNKSEPRLAKIKFATAKQSLDGKSVELYEYLDEEDKKTFAWSIKVEPKDIVFVNIKSIDVYKISLDDKHFITRNDVDFAELVCEEMGFKFSSLIDPKKCVKTTYKIKGGKENQLYFSLATMLFENKSMNSKMALYLESLRIEENLKK